MENGKWKLETHNLPTVVLIPLCGRGIPFSWYWGWPSLRQVKIEVYACRGALHKV